MFRKNAQPLGEPGAGQIFKDPPEHPAEDLIESAGLKGLQCGGAQVSSRHANFFAAKPGTTTSDLLKLIEIVRDRVYADFGIHLDLQIEVW